jgi:hypothetical protein
MLDNIVRPLILLCDNKLVVFFSKNNKSSGTSKWIDIKYLIVRNKIKDDTIVIQYINIRTMLADSLTNVLPPTLYKKYVVRMDLINEL